MESDRENCYTVNYYVNDEKSCEETGETRETTKKINYSIKKSIETILLSNMDLLINKYNNSIYKDRLEKKINVLKDTMSIVNTVLEKIIINSITISIILLSILLSVVVVSITHKTMKEDFPEDFEDYIAYEDKYDKDFYQLKREDIKEDKKEYLKNRYIEDETSNGKIAMYYNFDTSTFEYYYNNKNAITYPELEAVAKLFTIEYNCRSLFIEEEEPKEPGEPKEPKEPEEPKEPKEPEEPKEPKEEEKKRPSVFAKIKMYNKGDNSRDERNKSETKSSKGKDINRLDKMKKVGNHFKHVGKLRDLEKDIIKGKKQYEKKDNNKIILNIEDNNTENNNLQDNNLEDNNLEDNNLEDNNTEDNKIEDNNTEDNYVIIEDKSHILRDVSPPGKLIKRTPTKILPKNISFAEYKRQILEPNRKK